VKNNSFYNHPPKARFSPIQTKLFDVLYTVIIEIYTEDKATQYLLRRLEFCCFL